MVVLIAAIFSLFAIISTQGTIHDDSAVSEDNTKRYQPLYVVEESKNVYRHVDQATYVSVMEQENADESKQRMFAACSRTDTTEPLLQVISANEKELAEGFKCTAPIKFFTKQKMTAQDHYTIGFEISTSRYKYPISLMLVSYKNGSNRSITAWHEIKFATMISTEGDEPDDHSNNQSAYQKNIDIYGFDIDQIYQMDTLHSEYGRDTLKLRYNTRLVKLQLAPANDFFFDAWKEATRTNINTVAVWNEFTPEWHQLEKFIRRVAEVLGDLQIITGGADEDGSENIYYAQNALQLHSLPGPELSKNLPIFKYIFKAVSFNQQRENETWIRQGILFILVNDPREYIANRNDFVDKNGWEYLDNPSPKKYHRIIGKPMDPDILKHLQVKITEPYIPFNLNLVKKLSKNDNNEEIEIDVNVVDEIMKKQKK